MSITRDSIRRPVAEGILALMFALAKNLPALDRSCRTEAGGLASTKYQP